MDLKETLCTYLTSARTAVLWKLEGTSERDLRMPMTPTGTNLLGVVKHLASVEAGYFGECLGQPWPEPMPWMRDDAEPNADMWATADESPEEIIDRYRRVIAFADANIAERPLDAPARVSWWRSAPDTTLGRLLVHMTAETNRHAGQMDIVRESIDGAAGVREGMSNLPDQDEAWWQDYVARLRAVAEEAPSSASGGAGVTVSSNKQTVNRYLDGFRRSDHEQILSCLTDDIRWTVFGHYRIEGKGAYDANIEAPNADGSPELNVVRMVEEDDTVMAELTGIARFTDGSVLRMSMAEVFKMREGLICERRAWVIPLRSNDHL